MHSSLIAVVLCIFAQASGACAADEAALQTAASIRAHATHTTMKTQPAAAALPGAELITTAAAATRDGRAVRPAPRVSASQDEEQPRRAGPAMLLAALALMSGIALRRYGAGNQ